MRTSLVSVDESDSQAILFPLRPLFPYVQTGFGTGGGPPGENDAMLYEDEVIMGYQIPWFDLNWQQRLPLTINALQVPSIQANFPLLINDTYTELIGEVEAELRFTGEDQVQLEYEIQEFDSLTGLLTAWVKKPFVEDDDIIYIYFDNSDAVDEQNPPGVWDSNYKAVYHMEDDSDSTINAQDFTDSAGPNSTAKIGKGGVFIGNINRSRTRNPFVGFPTTEITIEFWVKTSNDDETIYTYIIPSVQRDEIGWDNQDNGFISFHGGAGQTTLILSDNNFHHIVVTWESSTGNILVYDDGVLADTILAIDQGETLRDNGQLKLAQSQTINGSPSGVNAFDGTIDEYRISDTVRSADYVETSFNNQNNSSTFYSTGSVEVTPGGSEEIIMEYEAE